MDAVSLDQLDWERKGVDACVTTGYWNTTNPHIGFCYTHTHTQGEIKDISSTVRVSFNKVGGGESFIPSAVLNILLIVGGDGRGVYWQMVDHHTQLH